MINQALANTKSSFNAKCTPHPPPTPEFVRTEAASLLKLQANCEVYKSKARKRKMYGKHILGDDVENES